METIKLSVTLELETSGDTEAVQLQWLLNLLRAELFLSRTFRSRIRRIQFLQGAPHAST
jgi:hypothetical protein